MDGNRQEVNHSKDSSNLGITVTPKGSRTAWGDSAYILLMSGLDEPF